MATNNAVNSPLAGTTGTGNFVGSTSPTLTTPIIGNATFSTLKVDLEGDYIADSLGQPIMSFGSGGASSVNYVVMQNNTAGNDPKFTATGSDSNINLTLNSKGTGGVPLKGTSAGGNAAAGYVGEVISNAIPFASAVSFTSTVSGNVTSISLTAGDWDVWGNILFLGVDLQAGESWINTVSATIPDLSKINYQSPKNTSGAIGLCAPYQRMSLSSTTTIYLSGNIEGTAPLTACGEIFARRAR